MAQSNLEYQNSFHLLLSDLDLKNYKTFQLITNLVKNIQCNMRNFIMQNFKSKISNFIITTDNNNEIILYNKNGEIKLAQCIQVDETVINTIIINFYKDIPIKCVNNNKTILAFLTDQGLIKKASQIINCNKLRKINLPNDEIYVMMSGNKIIVKNRRTKIKALDEYAIRINDLD